MMMRVLTEHGVQARPIFDGKEAGEPGYIEHAVYLIEEFQDGRLLAFDRYYGLIGVVQMTGAEFRSQIMPLAFGTTPASENIWAETPADTYFLEADEEIRVAKRENSFYWAREEREGRPTVQAFVLRLKARDGAP